MSTLTDPNLSTTFEAASPFDAGAKSAEALYANHGHNLNAHLDHFFRQINFKTEKDSIRPANVACAKAAFEQLMKSMNWQLANASFEALLKEKSGDKEFRDDGITPNWYHEFRFIVTALDFIRSGVIPNCTLESWGGADVLISALLRHDSGEDFGHGKAYIYAELEKSIFARQNAAEASNSDMLTNIDRRIFEDRHRATNIANIVDMMTRKDPKYDPETGQIEIDEKTGKKIRIPRYEGDMNQYFLQLYGHPFAGTGKLLDGIEGVSTRIIPEAFGTDSDGKFGQDNNERYFKEKWGLFGLTPYERNMAQKYPDFSEAIYTLDNMLGVNLIMLGIVNKHFSKDSKDNPRYESPINIARYVDRVAQNYQNTPPAFRADHIMVGRLETVARAHLAKAQEMVDNGELKTKADHKKYMHYFRMAEVLENAIYPAMIQLIGDRRGSLLQASYHMDYVKAVKPEPAL